MILLAAAEVVGDSLSLQTHYPWWLGLAADLSTPCRWRWRHSVMKLISRSWRACGA